MSISDPIDSDTARSGASEGIRSPSLPTDVHEIAPTLLPSDPGNAQTLPPSNTAIYDIHIPGYEVLDELGRGVQSRRPNRVDRERRSERPPVGCQAGERDEKAAPSWKHSNAGNTKRGNGKGSITVRISHEGPR